MNESSEVNTTKRSPKLSTLIPSDRPYNPHPPPLAECRCRVCDACASTHYTRFIDQSSVQSGRVRRGPRTRACRTSSAVCPECATMSWNAVKCHEMSRDAYVGGTRSPRGVRLPTVDRSPSRAYPGGSPLGRKPLRQTRSGNNSPEHGYSGYHHSSPYYREEDLGSPMLEDRGRPMTVGPGHHRSRSATR